MLNTFSTFLLGDNYFPLDSHFTFIKLWLHMICNTIQFSLHPISFVQNTNINKQISLSTWQQYFWPSPSWPCTLVNWGTDLILLEALSFTLADDWQVALWNKSCKTLRSRSHIGKNPSPMIGDFRLFKRLVGILTQCDSSLKAMVILSQNHTTNKSYSYQSFRYSKIATDSPTVLAHMWP